MHHAACIRPAHDFRPCLALMTSAKSGGLECTVLCCVYIQREHASAKMKTLKRVYLQTCRETSKYARPAIGSGPRFVVPAKTLDSMRPRTVELTVRAACPLAEIPLRCPIPRTASIQSIFCSKNIIVLFCSE